MNRFGRGSVMLFVGLTIGRLVVDGGFGAFVQQRMRWPLAIATVVMIVLGLVDVILALRSDDTEETRSVGPRVGWLLAGPILVLIAVAPTSLGAAAADRVDSFEPTRPDDLTALPEDDPFTMRVLDFATAAIWDETGALEGRQVILEGLVVNDDDLPGGYFLTRFLVSCCAADGIPIKIAVHDADATFADDDWIRATVTLRERSPAAVEGGYVEVDAIGVELLDGPPASPYESPF